MQLEIHDINDNNEALSLLTNTVDLVALSQ